MLAHDLNYIKFKGFHFADVFAMRLENSLKFVEWSLHSCALKNEITCVDTQKTIFSEKIKLNF